MESFGAKLRRERERRQIALKSIAERTKISVGLLEGLERDDLSRWPTGVFRKSFVRSYATSIGIDPDATLREFAECFPESVEPVLSAPIPQAMPARGGLVLSIRWPRSFEGRLAEWKNKWLSGRLPSRLTSLRGIDGFASYKESIAAIMKVEKP